MRNHFKQYLNVESLFTRYPPGNILELGALDGENTRNFLTLPETTVTVVTDGREGDAKVEDERVTWIHGVSYLEMPKLPPASFGAVVIDSDHNYWTARLELLECPRLLRAPGWIILHDTESFGRTSGHMTEYRCGAEYPLAYIQRCAHLGIMNAIEEFQWDYTEYAMVLRSYESCGAVAMRMT